MELTRRAVLGLGLGLGSVALATLTGCAPGDAAPTLRLACGERGGTYLQFGENFRDRLDTRRPDAVRVVETQGSAENVDLLRSGDADLGLCLADLAAERADGLQAVGRVYQNYLQCLVRADSDLSAAEQLAGLTVSIGAPRSGAALAARRMLEVGDPARWPRIRQLPLRAALDALEARELDAVFFSGGVPIPELGDRPPATALRLLDLDEPAARLARDWPEFYRPVDIAAGVYPGQNVARTVGIPNLLLVRPDVAVDAVRLLVDVLVDDAARLVPPGSLGVQYLTESSLIDTAPLELHPGALAAYRARYG
ncbi:TAXI family TRAP transporter solute-binding subunit [Microbacterium imperiale]|uniref:C4-dicarboxylate ABC transporter substrate-binding protein n=1 Tax=Microbacterium imperiale TaxID=33884 RepID=A0A9W6HJF3_9MICO|nr:TAXI family TRAP transporter solute-binding subunit [Microbacterium imperiale]MBP2421902.1 TRAP transporter TAXI family solute receptor [Microbacterium imperiale]MDS0198997.1 TAXI family TRAP transporter solute-binding subunit [Microbacterium imperiale]BFE39208.1 TAXI family TRAP transporter solute-binding subunit [Microbacterium imperiale]GLJ81198.1 C4-dicarboxylate ABC transporter substrate-binding protein [Microbacterium imperiale]